MTFETAHIVTTTIHYIISISILLSGTFVRNTDFLSAVFRFYLCVFIWAVICYLNNGCPFTQMENEIALHFYGKPFYENYGYNDTNVKALISWPVFYYPAIASLLIFIVKRISNATNFS